MSANELRPKQILREIGRQWPNAWKQFKMMRADKGNTLPDWPDWCYIPIAAGMAIATQGINDKIYEASFSNYGPAALTAAATWRVSQGVYRFDADLYNSLVNQPLDGNLPCEVLTRLPEWCVYIETINAKFHGSPIFGFWVHLESDAKDGRMELRFVIMHKNGYNEPVPIHLGDWTLQEGISRMYTEADKYAPSWLKKFEKYDFASEIIPFLQLVLYLCAENLDMPVKPAHPLSRATRTGRIDAPKEPRIWNVGKRIGASIRTYRNLEAKNISEPTGPIRQHASPRPHVRRAHWHYFWSGPRKGNRELILRWLPPIPVGVSEDENLPVVIHKVE